MTPYYDQDGITIYYGDCREVLPGLQPADCFIVDPPYGTTALAWDSDRPNWWPELFASRLVPSGSMWAFGTLQVFMELWEFLRPYWHRSQDLVWEKHNGSNSFSDRFRCVHELAAHFYLKDAKWADVFHEVQYTNTATARRIHRKQKAQHWSKTNPGLYLSMDGGPLLERSVIFAPSCHGTGVHPTQKPTALLSPLIRYACPPTGLLCDPFMGSGSSLLVAKREKRRAVGIEIEEKYCEAAANRLAQTILDFK